MILPNHHTLTLFPKTEDIDKALLRLMKVKTPIGRAIRVKPTLAQELSKYKVIRELSRMDLIDIASKKRGKKRSIVYIPPELHIKKEGAAYFFDFW